MADFMPTHPGEILESEFLEPMGLSAYVLAKTIDVPQARISAIIHSRRSISADTGLRLAKAFGLSDMFWINMQARYDADMARIEHGAELAGIRLLQVEDSTDVFNEST
ncbi:HigA family addiction module antitoxin [Mycolicibacterium wolinskyi]|uniref:HigA family addiction module antitoxin n=1 Tax=Mycolicibacterium wolinskyi TaxID=59750 RepID=UPI0039179DD9